jgi:hypothetical protein
MFSKIKSIFSAEFSSSPREQIRKIFQGLKAADQAQVDAVRQALLATQSLFNSRFGSIAGFQNLSNKEKFEYLERMLDLESDLLKQSKFAESLALKLFGLYLSTFLGKNKTADDEVFNSAARVWVESFTNSGLIP